MLLQEKEHKGNNWGGRVAAEVGGLRTAQCDHNQCEVGQNLWEKREEKRPVSSTLLGLATVGGRRVGNGCRPKRGGRLWNNYL